MTEIEKLFSSCEPLSAAESLVAEYYAKNDWDVANVKGCIAHFVLWCDYFRGSDVKDVETHIVSVEEYDGELRGNNNFQRIDFKGESKSEFKDPTQVHAMINPNGDIRLYEVTESKVLDIHSIKRRNRTSKTDIRREREVVITECRAKGWTWPAIAKRVGLSRYAVRRIWNHLNATIV
jgi:hypothetical protein